MTAPGQVAAESLFDFEIPRRSGNGPAPLSFAQELLWLMDRASQGTSVWNVPRAFSIRGPLDGDALELALRALCERHEVLRTVFEATADGPRQLVRSEAFRLTRVDLGGSSPTARAATCEALLREDAARPFDLARDVLLRATLVTLAPGERVLSLTSHHIVSDGWSKSVLFSELSALYEAFAAGRPLQLPALPIQFGDYAAWERAPARQASVADDLDYWCRRLSRLPALDLPTDFPRSQARSYDGARAVSTLPQTLVESMTALAKANGVTQYMLLLAAYATLLQRYGGQDDFAIGSPIAARMHEETEGLIGYLTNTLVLRCRLDGDPTFAQLLARVRETCLEAYEHQEIPFEQLVLKLQAGQELSHAPLFGALLTMEDTLPAALRLGAATVEPIEADSGGQIKVDLTLLAASVPDGLRLALWYRRDLYAPATAARMLAHLEALLESAVATPDRPLSELSLFSSSERAGLQLNNATSRTFPETLVPARFKAVAHRQGEALSVVCGDVRLSYAELAARAARLASRLADLGVGRGDFVGLALDRSADFVVGMLGILQAGAAYVPFLPGLPAARLASQLAQSGARVVVTASAYRDSLGPAVAYICLDEPSSASGEPDARGASVDGRAADGRAAVEVGAADPAYVLFTSGSTGVPKGVVVTHGNLANYVAALEARLDLDPNAPLSFGLVSSPAADLGNTALFPALCSGGTLHVIPTETARDGAAFAASLAASPVDVLKITPSHLRALLEEPARAAILPRRWLVLGGEACPWDLVRAVRALAQCGIVNHYGPTETTVGATTYLLQPADFLDARSGTVPIGSPLANATCYVLDAGGRELPAGIPGELYIGGLGVAAGYLGQPALTAERFLPDRFSGRAGARLYRTGDRVRRLAGGELEFLGRLDQQVKIRGYRVELGEIESTLDSHPAVLQSIVMLRERGAAEPQLVAYVVAPATALDQLRAWLQARLPDYMLPAAIVPLERLPLTANGKPDLAALPDPEVLSAALEFVAPRTPTEAAIAAIWAEVLHVERISVTDDFLALGFHSILAIRALGKLSRSCGVRLPLRALFEAPTIAGLAALVDAQLRRSEELELERALDLLDGLGVAAAADATVPSAPLEAGRT